ncbi:Neopentalenolactone D synthase [Lecanosticta acicola]|uniref:Neopentalenolactone D synthase n=1 Tax=Lecanosticta acicola TaxID=111012 RepID=A0AAI8Z0P9_9PEZI|nr:Neopentalenolactone D synthase [Lecanosticta acicola]
MATAQVLDEVDLLGPQQEQKAETEPAVRPFDPVELKEKYIAERDKRLQQAVSGINQYNLIEEHNEFAPFIKDIWADPNFNRDPVSEVVDVVIVGAGYGAQLFAVRLIEAGVQSIRMIDKAGGFGGTWYWNRYPGAQCDIESYIYMPLLEELGYIPTEKYARGKELLHHSEMIGRRWGLYDKTLFHTEVGELHWSEETGLWSVSTSRNDDIKCRFVITAGGFLHRPKLPGVKGISEFKGFSFHSSRWDYDYTGGDHNGVLTNLADKRVAVIGTGATAVQIVPNVAKYAKALYVYQRTPSAIHVRGNKPTDEAWAKSLKPGWQKERMENFNSIVHGAILPVDLVQDAWTDVLQKLLARGANDLEDPEKAAIERQMADFDKMNQTRGRCDEVVKDRATAEKLKPWYNQLCKRPCFHDEYLQAFNQDNVHLIDTNGAGVERITEKAIVANGEEIEVDCIIYATGFEIATDWSHRTNMEVYGRNGQTITSCWKDGTRTLHGWTTRGFPNCFWVGTVQSALTPNYMHGSGERAKHLAYVVSEAVKRNIRTVEPTEEAEKDWVRTIEESAALGASFARECTPGYYNNEGTANPSALRNATYGGGSPAFIKLMEDWRAEGNMHGLDLRYFDAGENDATVSASSK